MDSWLRFFHLAMPGVWLGAALVLERLLVAALKADRPEQLRWGLEWARRLSLVLPGLAATLTLGSGLWLFFSLGLVGKTMPLWFKVMESGGGSLALITVVLLAFAVRRLQRALRLGQGDLRRATLPLLYTLRTSMVGVASVLLAVAFRLR